MPILSLLSLISRNSPKRLGIVSPELRRLASEELAGNDFPDSLQPEDEAVASSPDLATGPTDRSPAPAPAGDLSGRRRRPFGCPEPRAERRSRAHDGPMRFPPLEMVNTAG